MKARPFSILLAAFVMGLVFFNQLIAKDDPSLKKPSGTQSVSAVADGSYGFININNWEFWLEWNGRSAYNPFIQGDGGVYPKGTSFVIFQDGFVFGGPLIDTRTGQPPASQPIRVGGQNYQQGMLAGAVIGGVPETPPSPPSATHPVRVYRIRRDYIDEDVDLKEDAARYFQKGLASVTDGDVAALKAQYDRDWKEWPVSKGAPYIERNGTPGYQAPPAVKKSADLIANHYDEPGLAGADPNSPADAVVWTVANDFNATVSRGFMGSDPTGIELQITLWGYKSTGPLGNVVFRKFRMINKGVFRSDTMFVAQWSDPDLGAFGDDLAGCDPALSMGYIWNSNSIDTEFRKFGLPPPAGGYDFFQGPLVPGSASDVGIFDLKRRPGFKNLGMYHFGFFSAGSPIPGPDPAAGTYEGTLRWWNMLNGYQGLASTSPRTPWRDRNGAITLFPVNGDPVAGTGDIDGKSPYIAPGDRRIYMVSGPFKIAPGDTQEVVVGIVAGLGADKLSSISVMKFNDRFAQATYNDLFAVPTPPGKPSVVARELDGRIVLDWGSDLTSTSTLEGYTIKTYKFQGYNVYQFPARTSTLADAKRLATYDVIDQQTVVLDDQFDASSGQILKLPVQFGGNTGIQRYFSTTSDIFTGKPLRNGQEYYFAVTAYAVGVLADGSADPQATPLTLESTPSILTLIPQSPKPGVRYSGTYGQALTVEHTAGSSDGIVTATVVDPGKTTGATYTVGFRQATKGIEWDLKRGGTTVYSSTNQGSIPSFDLNDDFNYPTVDGLYVTVAGPPPGAKGGDPDNFQGPDPGPYPPNAGWAIPNGSRRFTWADGFTGNGTFQTFSEAGGTLTIGWSEPAYVFGLISERTVKPSELKNTLLKLAAASSSTARNPNAGNNPYGGWDENNPGSDPNFSYGYRYLRGATAAPARPEFAPYIVNPSGGYAYQDYKRGVPLSAWNVEANPPARLAVGFLENNVSTGLVDGKWWPGANGTGTSGASASVRDWLFIFNRPYTDATPGTELQKDILNNPMPVMWFLGVQRRGGNNFFAGDEFLIIPNRVNTPTDVFTFTSPSVTTSTDLAQVDVKKINVFPNPYYAFNAAETNRFIRFVTFNFLPKKATVRIFNLAGQLVRVLEKDDDSQFLRWDLNNQSNFPVASGMYIAHISMPDLGEKIVKFAIIQEQEILEVF
jgi:hypothetical protein